MDGSVAVCVSRWLCLCVCSGWIDWWVGISDFVFHDKKFVMCTKFRSVQFVAMRWARQEAECSSPLYSLIA